MDRHKSHGHICCYQYKAMLQHLISLKGLVNKLHNFCALIRFFPQSLITNKYITVTLPLQSRQSTSPCKWGSWATPGRC